MSSNGPLESCCEVLNEHLIGHVLRGQNGESIETLCAWICDLLSIAFNLCMN